METKPLLFPYSNDESQIESYFENESTSIYEIPHIREKSIDEQKQKFDSARAKTIVLRNGERVEAIILRNNFAKLYVQTETNFRWIQKTRIRNIL